MLEIITKSAHNFISHQLRKDSSDEESNLEEGYMASIEVTTERNAHAVVDLYFEKEFLNMVCLAMLFEEINDDETLVDMCSECVNLIVGSAKMIAENEKGFSFKISTPNYHGYAKLNESYHKISSLIVDNSKITIALKEC